MRGTEAGKQSLLRQTYRYCELIAKKPGESGLLAVALPDSQA